MNSSMLKKTGHIILTLLVLVATTGLTFSKHYCGNELKSVKFFSEAKLCCSGPCKCCHNETVTVKISDDFSANSFLFDFCQSAFEIPIKHILIQKELPESFEKVARVYDLPPPPVQTVLSSLQTYLL
jgi:hypothetical protein